MVFKHVAVASLLFCLLSNKFTVVAVVDCCRLHACSLLLVVVCDLIIVHFLFFVADLCLRPILRVVCWFLVWIWSTFLVLLVSARIFVCVFFSAAAILFKGGHQDEHP